MTKQTSVVKMVSQLEMVGFLKTNGTSCRFVSILCNTPVTKIKVSCPFKGVRKIARKIGLLNANYNTSVRNRIAAKLGVEVSEVEYENGEVWYKHLTTTDGKALPLVVNKTKEDGKFYLQYSPHHSTHKYVSAQGDEIPEEQLKPYFYAQAERPDFKPFIIAINLENVCELKASGVIIQMPDYEEAEQLISA